MLKYRIKWDGKTAVINVTSCDIERAIAIALGKKEAMVYLIDILIKNLSLSREKNTNIVAESLKVYLSDRYQSMPHSLASNVILTGA